MLTQLTPLDETRAYRDIFSKGKAKGEADGKAKGEAAGKVDSLQRLLRRRFGALPDWAIERIGSTELPQLNA